MNKIALLILGVFAGLFLHAQPSRYSYELFVDGGDTLRYRQLYPDANPYRKYPLVIFLHGSGERGRDNDAQLKWGAMQFATDRNMSQYPAFVIAPQCPEGQTWANLESEANGVVQLEKPTKPMELLLKLIEVSVASLPVDPDRVYITGLSMGGFGTFDALGRRPDLFAAAIPVCGGGDVSKAQSYAHIPIWILTGAEDNVVKPDFSTRLADALFDAGAKPGLTLYPEVGHFSWLMAYDDPLVMQWLFRQRRGE